MWLRPFKGMDSLAHLHHGIDSELALRSGNAEVSIYSRSGYGPFPPSAMKRSILASRTGSGTQPNSRTAS